MKKQDYTLQIDFEIFTVEEIATIYSFFDMVEKFHKHKISKQKLIESYNNYRKTINSIQLEKKYDKLFFNKTGISIYKTMQALI